MKNSEIFWWILFITIFTFLNVKLFKFLKNPMQNIKVFFVIVITGISWIFLIIFIGVYYIPFFNNWLDNL